MALLKLDALNVATIYVDDLAKNANFYEMILGFKLVKEIDPGLLLQHQGAGITIYLEGGRAPREAAGTKFPQIALCFNSAEGVKRACKALEDAKVPVIAKYGDFSGPFAGFQFLDPSGNLLEIAGEP